jgi:ATP adenylyltransferase
METMFSPWRTEYIDSFKNESPDGREECFFCSAVNHPDEDERRFVVARFEYCFAILNRYPYNSGHLLIAPYRHVGTLEDISDNEYREIGDMARVATKVIKAVMQPHGFNIGMNLGRVAGAGVPGHVHLHVVPRWSGDSNFMSSIGEIKVVSQSLASTREAFASEFSRIVGGK